MFRIASILSILVLLAACGEDQQAPKPQTSAAPAPAATSSDSAPPAAPATTAEMPAADDEIQYDPIDVSKLDSNWWQQYSAGE